MSKYVLLTKVCVQCGQPLQTTSKREKVHAKCREAFYAEYQKKRYVNSRFTTYQSNVSKNRKHFFLFGEPCEACGFDALTRKKVFYNEVTKQPEEHTLCPNCYSLWRCGLMKAFSWAPINEAAERIAEHKQVRTTVEAPHAQPDEDIPAA